VQATLAVGGAAAYTQSRAVQATALACAAAEGAQKVTNAINIFKERHGNAFLTRGLVLMQVETLLVMGDLIVHSPAKKMPQH
jgi:hypothetical protein